MTYKATIWMTGALISFCLLAIGARELSGTMDTLQMLFYRSLTGLLVISGIIIYTSNTDLFKTQHISLHALRNIFHFGGQYGWFVGIGLLPLAEVFALEFTVPFWTALISSLFLKEKFTPVKFIAIVLGMLGVAIIVKPGIAIADSATLIVLAAAICYAISHTSTKLLTVTESPLTILFFMCLLQLPISFCLALFNWTDPVGIQWLWIAVIGLTALSAHYCMSRAMQYAEISAIVIMDFLRLPLIALVGIIFYSENYAISLIIGTLLMLAGNLLNIHAGVRKFSGRSQSPMG